MREPTHEKDALRSEAVIWIYQVGKADPDHARYDLFPATETHYFAETSDSYEAKTTEPKVEQEKHGIRVSFKDGRWHFYPWANVRSVFYERAPDGE